MSDRRHRISPPKLEALMAALDDKARISAAEVAEILSEPGSAVERALAHDPAWVEWAQISGIDLVEPTPEEAAQVREGLRKAELVDKELAAERDAEARRLAAEERRANEEVDAAWPAWEPLLLGPVAP